jgi:hypothetical protein
MSRTRGRRLSSRAKHRAARRRFLAGLTLFTLALVAAVLVAGRWSPQPAVGSDTDVPQTSVARDLPAVPAAATERTVYPYSIIAGGARGVDELKQAIAGDPVVAAHYAGFDLEKTHAVRLEQPKLAHVSYRIGNAVYWTRRALLIQAGETVLTDGVRIARTRCGNQLADTPGEISTEEPVPAVLDTQLPFIVAGVPAGMLPLSAVQTLPEEAGGISLPPLGGQMSGILGGGPMFGSGPSAGAAIGLDSEQPASDSQVSDNSTDGDVSDFPAPPGDSMPPFDGPPNTPDPPKWLVPPEILLPPGEDLPPGFLDPGHPGGPQTPTEVAPIPEPGTAVLMLGGTAAYIARRLKKKAARDNRTGGLSRPNE